MLTWVSRLCRLAPVGAVAQEQELVHFDTQLLEHAEISAVEYRQGELAGYAVREYLLEKVGRTCAYCGATGVPLQVEHMVPKVRGGTNRVSNLTIACAPCKGAKGAKGAKGVMTATEFGHPEVQAQARLPLNDAAAVTTTRWALYRRLPTIGVPVEVGSGGRTKWNRTQRGLPTAHWLDAACVGASTLADLRLGGVWPLCIRATGHGNRQLCGTNHAGFPIRHRTLQTRHVGFATGDLVRAVVPAGLKTAGRHVGRALGRALGRASGSFDVATVTGRVQGISYRYGRVGARGDGYAYSHRGSDASSPA